MCNNMCMWLNVSVSEGARIHIIMLYLKFFSSFFDVNLTHFNVVKDICNKTIAYIMGYIVFF